MESKKEEIVQAIGIAMEEEANRWSERLDWLHTEYGADCSGCDSGDPLDLVEVEIRQALEAVKVRTAKEISDAIMAHICTYPHFMTETEGATCGELERLFDAINKKYGLEI